jgi:hypothetical protein
VLTAVNDGTSVALARPPLRGVRPLEGEAAVARLHAAPEYAFSELSISRAQERHAMMSSG